MPDMTDADRERAVQFKQMPCYCSDIWVARGEQLEKKCEVCRLASLIAAVRAEYAPAVDLLRAMVERFPIVPHGETAMDREDWLADTQVQRAAVEWLAAHGRGGGE